MKTTFSLAALVTLLFGVIQAQSQSVNFNFQDGTSDGWSDSGFGSTPLSTVTTIGGDNYIVVPIGGFQVANFSSSDSSSAFFQAMAAAAQNPSGYTLSYNWSVNTATFTGATVNSFLQVGTFVNGGDGAYAQDFGTVKEVELNGAQLASGSVFQGTVSVNMGAAGLALTQSPAETFFRLGLIENGDSGVPYQVEFTDISVSPVPEPTSLALLGLAAPALWLIRRRHSAHCRAVSS